MGVMIFSGIIALLALATVLASRFWMLRRIRDAEEKEERPFDYEDELKNPYEE